MDKAILVIDMPNNCHECPCCEIWDILPSVEEYSCAVKNTSVDKYNKPDWCPLKPVPEKYDISELGDIVKAESSNAFDVGCHMYNMGHYRGYNLCIDKILGN